MTRKTQSLLIEAAQTQEDQKPSRGIDLTGIRNAVYLAVAQDLMAAAISGEHADITTSFTFLIKEAIAIQIRLNYPDGEYK